jgi:hypothetical protein
MSTRSVRLLTVVRGHYSTTHACRVQDGLFSRPGTLSVRSNEDTIAAPKNTTATSFSTTPFQCWYLHDRARSAPCVNSRNLHSRSIASSTLPTSPQQGESCELLNHYREMIGAGVLKVFSLSILLKLHLQDVEVRGVVHQCLPRVLAGL